MKNNKVLSLLLAGLMLAQAPVAAFNLPAWPAKLNLSENKRAVRNHVLANAAIFTLIQVLQVGANAYKSQETRGIDTRNQVEKWREVFATIFTSKEAWLEHYTTAKSIVTRKGDVTRDPLLGGAAVGYGLWKAAMSVHLLGAIGLYGVKVVRSVQAARAEAARAAEAAKAEKAEKEARAVEVPTEGTHGAAAAGDEASQDLSLVNALTDFVSAEKGKKKRHGQHGEAEDALDSRSSTVVAFHTRRHSSQPTAPAVSAPTPENQVAGVEAAGDKSLAAAASGGYETDTVVEWLGGEESFDEKKSDQADLPYSAAVAAPVNAAGFTAEQAAAVEAELLRGEQDSSVANSGVDKLQAKRRKKTERKFQGAQKLTVSADYPLPTLPVAVLHSGTAVAAPESALAELENLRAVVAGHKATISRFKALGRKLTADEQNTFSFARAFVADAQRELSRLEVVAHRENLSKKQSAWGKPLYLAHA
jgi:hypothetical protein